MRVPQILLPACVFFSGILFPAITASQEFPKGWVFPLEIGQGAVTAFDHTPDLYLGSLSFTPQYTLITGRLRTGATVAGAYTGKRVYGIAGPHLAVLLTDQPRVLNSTVLNVQLTAEHCWGTGEQRLAGGGLTAELGQLATFSLKALRDYRLGAWWLSAGLGVHLFSKKPSDNPFDDIR
ncbi:hypothetical protein [Chitinophaga japonensis]|uniref:Outer membrane protein with beta-barrel domain n=1 Tax=Chitinophaga japonensis TaxID=104662 RepID=A0A562TBR7_CHIJA|nr:hypothetical protein [Chitinophaga japonensis]TWI90724.1 hypothetical protein LX66_0084 [Chitinophaga japonensis]